MTRTKLYSELFNRYNRERRQFFLDCREESGRQNLRMLKKITILLVPFILFAFFFTPFLVRGWTISLPYYVLLLRLLFLSLFCGRLFLLLRFLLFWYFLLLFFGFIQVAIFFLF